MTNHETFAYTPPSARQLLHDHGLPEDVVDGVLCLHAQEMAAVQRNAHDTIRPYFHLGQPCSPDFDCHVAKVIDLIDPTRAAPAAVSVPPPAPRADDLRCAVCHRADDGSHPAVCFPPAPADRAATFREAAEALGRMDYDTDSHDYGYDTYRDAWNGGVMDGADLLRRLADEPPTATKPEACPTPESHNWGCGCPGDRLPLYSDRGVDTPGCDCGHNGMGMRWHSEACLWIGGLLAEARELLSKPEPAAEGAVSGPVAGEQQNETPEAETQPFAVQVWPLARVLAEVRCGSQDWTWDEEWADLDARHAATGYLNKLEQQIQANGITMPVLIGTDGRLWDGHHRLRIAVRLGIDYVPVEVPAVVAQPGKETSS